MEDERIKDLIEEMEGCAHDVLDICRQMQNAIRDFKQSKLDRQKILESKDEKKKRLVIDSNLDDSK